jgi:molybdate transport system regulatory protein
MAKSYKVRAGKTTSRQQEEKTGYQVNGRIWVEKDGELYLGWGRIMLLDRIRRFGSIAAAARSMKLSYRNAWLWVEAMNRLAPVPLVEKVVGGNKGGHARVTKEGQKAILQYKGLREKFQEFIKQTG